MFKNRTLQVKMVKDTDIIQDSPDTDFETKAAHVATVSAWVAREGTKMIAATMILNAGCKILINRLSK
jgi:hypothetical protein